MKTFALNSWALVCLLFLAAAVSAQATWESLNGPPGGTVNSIAVDPDGDLYIAAGFESLYKSENDGENWELLNFPASEPMDIYVLSDGTLIVSDGTGMWRSVNDGQTWSKVSGLRMSAVVQTSDETVFGATDNGIYKSVDQGLHWTATGLANIVIFDISLGNSDDIWVAGLGGFEYKGMVFRSADFGETWDLMLEGPSGGQPFLSIQVLPSGTVLTHNWEKIFRSYDQGLSWAGWANPGLEVLWQPEEGVLYGSTYDLGLFRSDDEGSSWGSMGLEGYIIQCLAGKPGGWIFAGLYNLGVMRWNEESPVWEFANEGIVSSTVFVLAMNSGGKLYGLMENGFLSIWDQASGEWSLKTLPEGYYFYHFFVSPDNTLILSNGYELFLSSDEGATWTNVTTFGALDMVFAVDGTWYAAGQKVTLYDVELGIFRSNDQGLSWENIFPVTGEFWWAEHLYISSQNTLFFFFMDESGPHNVRSVDGGETWTQIAEFQSLLEPHIAEGPGILYAMGPNAQTYSTWIFTSSDDGATWEYVKQIGFECMDLVVNTHGHLFLNTGQNIFKSSNGGKTWKLYGIGEFSDYNTEMLLAPDDVLYAAYYSHGVWRTATPTTPVAELPQEWLLPISLSPNPATDLATVSFYLSETSLVRLEVFNAEGRTMGVLQERSLSAGPHAMQVQTVDWPAGIYFLRLSGDAGMGMVRMIKK